MYCLTTSATAGPIVGSNQSSIRNVIRLPRHQVANSAHPAAVFSRSNVGFTIHGESGHSQRSTSGVVVATLARGHELLAGVVVLNVAVAIASLAAGRAKVHGYFLSSSQRSAACCNSAAFSDTFTPA